MDSVKDFAISRVLGNELHPRDAPGSRMKTLEYILNTEPEFDNTYKLWVVNHIHDKSLRQNYIELLNDYGQLWIESSFDKKVYSQLKQRDDRIRYAINVNHARNLGFHHAKQFAKYIFVLDGDMFFDQRAWARTTNEMYADGMNRPYYGVPAIRVVPGFDFLHAEPVNYRLWEQSQVFRHDTILIFDENIPFSKSERIELMKQIGYEIIPDGKLPLLSGEMCKDVGWLYHISFSDEKIETDMMLRIAVREEAVNRLLNKLDAIKLL